MALTETLRRNSGWPCDFVIAESDARTASYTGTLQENVENFRGVRVYIEATDSADTPSVTFSIQLRDRRSGEYHTVLTSVAVTGASRKMLEVYPGGALIANERATWHVGRGFRVISTAADADSLTYQIHGEWLP